jgi:hypothetical protein
MLRNSGTSNSLHGKKLMIAAALNRRSGAVRDAAERVRRAAQAGPQWRGFATGGSKRLFQFGAINGAAKSEFPKAPQVTWAKLSDV